jgi:ACS family glucarate transporter-like MFS transporter
VSAKELEIIQSGLTIHTGSAAKKQLVPWGKVLKSREVWAVTFSYFCYGYVAWMFFSWFYIYLAQVRGLNLKASAFYAMLPFLAMAACSPLGGVINDRLTKRRGPRAGRCILAVFAIVTAGIFLAFGSQGESAASCLLVVPEHSICPKVLSGP